MPIPFTCPHCGLETNVADQFAGQTGPCSKCGETVTVPVPSGAAPFGPPPTLSRSSSSAGPVVLIVVLVVVGMGALVLCLGLPMMWMVRSPRPAPRVVPMEAVPPEPGYAEVPSPMAAGPDARSRAECMRNLKKIEIMAGNLEEAMTRISDINELAATFNVNVDTANITFSGMSMATIARDNEVVGKLFNLPAGQLSGPFTGNFGAYVVIIDDILEAPTKENYAAEERSDKQGWGNRVSNSLFDALKKEAVIEDNRMLFY